MLDSNYYLIKFIEEIYSMQGIKMNVFVAKWLCSFSHSVNEVSNQLLEDEQFSRTEQS